MQKRYWDFMKQQKFNLYYSNYIYKRNAIINKIFTIFTALIGSSSVAVLAIWNKFPTIWSAVVTISQILTVVFNNLPYKERSAKLSGFISAYSDVYLLIEQDWYNVASGQLQESEINDLIANYQKKLKTIDRIYGQNDSILYSKKASRRAQEITERYFQVNFINAD